MRAGRDAGLSRRTLYGTSVDRPHQGIRGTLWRDIDAARDLLPALRDGDRLSHSTAARLWPLPLPRDLESEQSPVHVSGPKDANRLRRPGVIGHRTVHTTSIERNGFLLSDPARLFLELASELSVADLVAVGDQLVREPPIGDPLDPRPWLPMHDLHEAVRRARTPRAEKARRAVALVREGSDSRRETQLRLAVVAAGLPEPELNTMVLDRRGDEIGRFDLRWRRFRVLAEYDGDQHRTDPVQYDRDISRFDRATMAGERVLRFRARHLRSGGGQAVHTISEALAERGYRGRA
ncbi:very-short-patch-repair endonuclease [Schumannella luteola]|uniref:Very-short-patch-repair endonuclease n=1 Tax=Schumannella luteola TaxID=472059 RepID=A0A852YAP7_9MICO|nr:hypothetical protein [Schumannella luteola]NYG98271.1 very-short-patch-repair endonuclease [Schumannella luteola]